MVDSEDEHSEDEQWAQWQKENEMMKQFVKLCEVGDLKGVEKALLSGTCVNSRPRYGSETGLIAALKQKHTAVVRLLLEQDGIDINGNHNNALYYASKHAENSDSLAMLKARPELVEVNEAFVDLCGDGDLEGVWKELQNGAHVNSVIKNDRGEIEKTALMAALELKNKDVRTAMVSLLLEQEGIDLNHHGRGENALYWASRYDVKIEYLDLVLAQPRFVAANIGFYFVELCAAGDLEGVKKLLEDGVDVNSLDLWNRTGLMAALERKQSEMAIFLLKQDGIDVNIGDKNGWTAMSFAADDDENSGCLAMLLAHPHMDEDNVNNIHQYGWTSLHSAVQSGAVRCLQLLLSDERSDPNMEYYDGYEGDTPLMLAVKYNHVGCVEVLLANPRVDVMTRDWRRKSKEEVSR